MVSNVVERLYTVEEFWEHYGEGARYELFRGELVQMTPTSDEHAELLLILGSYISPFVRQHKLGKAYGGDIGFRIRPDEATVLAPDIAFLKQDALPPGGRTRKFLTGPPTLAVEIVSPHDRPDDVQQKARAYLEAGTELVWVVYPEARQIMVYRSLDKVRVLTLESSLEGEDVLPGFSVPVREIFEDE